MDSWLAELRAQVLRDDLEWEVWCTESGNLLFTGTPAQVLGWMRTYRDQEGNASLAALAVGDDMGPIVTGDALVGLTES